MDLTSINLLTILVLVMIAVALYLSVVKAEEKTLSNKNVLLPREGFSIGVTLRGPCDVIGLPKPFT